MSKLVGVPASKAEMALEGRISFPGSARALACRLRPLAANIFA